MAAYAVFNALSAVATSFGLLLLARFLDGLPHGAYFGVASLVAASLAAAGAARAARSPSVMLGLSVANVVGVPGGDLARPAPRLALGLLGRRGARAGHRRDGAGLRAVGARRPRGHRTPRADGVLRKPQVWLTLLAGAIGFGGMFAVFSYIAPTVTEVGGLGDGAVPVFLLVFGLGMVAGTWAAGELADWSVFRVARARLGRHGRRAAALLAGSRPTGWGLLPVAFLITVPRLGAGGQPPAAADGRRRRRRRPSARR